MQHIDVFTVKYFQLTHCEIMKMDGWQFVTSRSNTKEKNEQELNSGGDHEHVSSLGIYSHLVREDYELLLGEEMVFIPVMITFSTNQRKTYLAVLTLSGFCPHGCLMATAPAPADILPLFQEKEQGRKTKCMNLSSLISFPQSPIQ